jgi:hypothetical protein
MGVGRLVLRQELPCFTTMSPPLPPPAPLLIFIFCIIFFPEGGSNLGEGTIRGDGGKRINNLLLFDMVGDGEEVDFILDDDLGLSSDVIVVVVIVDGPGGGGGGSPATDGRVGVVLSITTAL